LRPAEASVHDAGLRMGYSGQNKGSEGRVNSHS
jgi:hypothetical protein